MDTHVSLVMQETMRLECLLESLVSDIHYIPGDALAVAAPDDLPRPLRELARAQRDDETWRAWTNGPRVWFVAGKLSPSLSKTPHCIALQVCFYDHRGNLASCGVWALQPSGRWVLRVAGASATQTPATR